MTLFITGVKPSGQAKLEVSKNHALARGYLYVLSSLDGRIKPDHDKKEELEDDSEDMSDHGKRNG